MSNFSFAPIGKIESVFKEKFGTPRQPGLVPASTAVIQLDTTQNLVPALSGLSEFSYVWIIFVFHKNSNKTFTPKVYPPRLGGGKMGVFATRSPHRPNPIGLSCAKIEKIEESRIYLSGIDIIDGTPVLDIKPYIPAFDSKPEAKSGWIDRLENSELSVEWSDEAKLDLQEKDPDNDLNLREMIEDILSGDPRNPMDKDITRESKRLGFYLGDFNVVFSVKAQVATVLTIENI